MRVTTQSSIDITESLAAYLLGAHIYRNLNQTAKFEKRLNGVTTGKYSIADVYIPDYNTAIEVKSVAHGSSALKGVVQASMYKEAVDQGILCMQRPRRNNLCSTLTSMADSLGVGIIFIDSVLSILDKETIGSATGGCAKPFEIWKRDRYTTTKKNIIARSQSDWIEDYLDTVEQSVCEHRSEIFDYVVDPDSHVGGLSDIY